MSAREGGESEASGDMPEQTLVAYRDELHLTMIVVLMLFLALLLFAGWQLRPTSTALHISESPIQCAVAADPGGNLDTLSETMNPMGRDRDPGRTGGRDREGGVVGADLHERRRGHAFASDVDHLHAPHFDLCSRW